jgi:hypothetical protein
MIYPCPSKSHGVFKGKKMQKITKWTKCFVVQIYQDNEWVTKTKPITELQAIRFMLQDSFLNKFYKRNEARVTQI